MKNIVRLIFTMCLAEVLSMASFATFPALLPEFQAEWGLSNTEAGWINAIYYGGYLVAVLILVSLTDREDPRKIYLFCMTLTVATTAGFALLAEGFWSALILRALAGVGLAGTYMPGLKLLSDMIEGPAQSRAVAFYTSSFGIGSSLSYFLTGKVAIMMGWQMTFALAAIGPVVSFLMVFLLFPPMKPPPREDDAGLRLEDFIRVLKNRRAMGYVMAYTVHNWELFGLRGWVVAYLTWINKIRPELNLRISPSTLAAMINLMGLPSSVLGNELASRFNRPIVASLVMLISAGVAFSLGFAASIPGWAIVLLFMLYGGTITAESSTVTAGTVAEAEEGLRGTTMAVHSSIGFLGSFLGPLVYGVVLDLSGRGESLSSWWMAFGSMGLAVATGPIMLLMLTGISPPESEKKR